MLKHLRLTNFRAFSDFTITFGDGAYLVGPNNAGKSTILTALRTADVLIRYAHRRNPDRTALFEGRKVTAYPLSLAEFPALEDSLRHEFGLEETRMELTWKSGARMVAVWPRLEERENDDDVEEPFFYLERLTGMQVRSVAQARQAFPLMGVIPILVPLEHKEVSRDDAYVTRNIAGRLSSRHFRNQLRMLEQQNKLRDFLDWADEWLGDIKVEGLGHRVERDGMILEAYYTEAESSVRKELVWAGDGIQVWLQLLYHVRRVSDRDVLVLDEPEVYLHPDLQRRLVQLLESTGTQVIVATHSSEMVAEADPRLVLLVDKARKRARRASNEADLEMLSSTLGTAFNLRLARALRSRVALFVEGQDMTVLRRTASILGLKAVGSGQGVTTISLNGYSRWGQIEPFRWLSDELLPEALDVFVILDRDYRPEAEIVEVEKVFRDANIRAHVWRRKELESYLLTPSVISRLSGMPEAQVIQEIQTITDLMETDVFGRLLHERIRYEVTAKNHSVDVTSVFKGEFDSVWPDTDFRMKACPPKQIIAGLNRRLQELKFRPITTSGLARGHRVGEVPREMATILNEVEGAVARWRSP